MRTLDKLIIGIILIVAGIIYLAWSLVVTDTANAHYKPGTHNAIHAIQKNWCGNVNRSCWRGNQAIAVAKCESGRYWHENHPQDARNGQYRGMLQMGSWERGRFGHGPSVWHQARAAHRYYVLSGWRPWECASILGIR